MTVPVWWNPKTGETGEIMSLLNALKQERFKLGIALDENAKRIAAEEAKEAAVHAAAMKAEEDARLLRDIEHAVKAELMHARLYWPQFCSLEKRILKLLDADSETVEHARAHGWTRPYEYTLRSAYEYVIRHFGQPKPLPKMEFVLPVYYASKQPTVADFPVGTRVRIVSQQRSGVVIPRPYYQPGTPSYIWVLVNGRTGPVAVGGWFPNSLEKL